MRKWMLNLHLYGGLLCSAYLLVLGITSLNFNHRWEFAKPAEDVVSWERPITLPATRNKQDMAENVRGQLGLIGWIPPWQISRDPQQNLTFTVSHPGKDYRVQLLLAERRVQVQETRKGFWPVLSALHGMRAGLPRSRFITAWCWYTELTTFIVVFAALSGVYLWAFRRRGPGAPRSWLRFNFRGRRTGYALLVLAALTLGMMFWVTLRG